MRRTFLLCALALQPVTFKEMGWREFFREFSFLEKNTVTDEIRIEWFGYVLYRRKLKGSA